MIRETVIWWEDTLAGDQEGADDEALLCPGMRREVGLSLCAMSPASMVQPGSPFADAVQLGDQRPGSDPCSAAEPGRPVPPHPVLSRKG